MTCPLALDIGSYSIKAVQLTQKKESFELQAVGEAKHSFNLFSNSETDKQALASLLKKVIKEAKFDAKNSFLTLSESASYCRVIEMPYLSEDELAAAINYEAEQYIPESLSQVKLEYLVLFSSPLFKKMEVLLIAAKKFAVTQLAEISERAGLIPLVMETEALSLARLVNLIYNKNCLVLHLGHTSAIFLIFTNGNLRFVRSINIGGETFTKILNRELNLDFLQAEEYKKTYGLKPDVLEGRVRKTLFPIFNNLLIEIKKSLDYFLQKYPQEHFSLLFLSGGSALMPGLNSSLADFLGMEVLILNPFVKLKREEKFNTFLNKASFSCAVGLALREE